MRSTTRSSLLITLVFLCLAAAVAGADDFPGTYTFHGYVRADYGRGDRYSDEKGKDNLGISQGVLIAEWKYKNVRGVLLLGGTNLTTDDSDGDGDFGIKDAYIVWSEIGGTGLELSSGVQPLFFGLKANGFPSDRSLQASIEFGGAGNFAVSRQAGPSLIARYHVSDAVVVEGAVFDTSASTAGFGQPGLGGIDGSSIDKNYFVQLKYSRWDAAGPGFYGILGYEGRYVGANVNATEPIFSLGAGYHNQAFDFSLEYFGLDRNITGTADDESYLVAELTYNASDRLSLLLDYADANEADVQTLRAGLVCRINQPFDFHLEYARDDFANDTVDSVDARLTFTF